MREIERKFLIKNETYKQKACKISSIVQGFLNSNPNRTVRIRVQDKKGFITVKGLSNKSGTTRFEWEKEIPYNEAKKLLELCEPNLIEKKRYAVKVGKHTFEIDEFFGENKGLTIAEIELATEKEPFKKPNWLGKEITGDVRYYNSNLSKLPYRNWAI